MNLPYELGEMKSANGEILRYEVETLSSEIAIKIFQIIKDCDIYKEIENNIKSPKVSLYFQKMIKLEIYPVIVKLCVLRWYKRNNLGHKIEEETISIPAEGIFNYLHKVWPDKMFTLKIEKRVKKFNVNYCKYLCQVYLKKNARTVVDKFFAIYNKLKYPNAFSEFSTQNHIALQYTEGLDLQRRSDMVWFPKSGIDPERVLVYFDATESTTGKPISRSVLDAIEELGMKWVHLRNGIIERCDMPAWYPPVLCDNSSIVLKLNAKSSEEKWIAKIGRTLLKDVKYWLAFYKQFNIKVNFIISEGTPKYIAQSIAIKQCKSEEGVLVFKQRSEMFWPSQSLLGHYPSDIFFSWTPRTETYNTPNVNKIQNIVSVGYPNDFIFKRKLIEAHKTRKELRSNGVSFIISLFDNVYGPVYSISQDVMEKFYLVFLEWLLNDKSVGLIIKTKKPHVINGLSKIQNLFKESETTGRCIYLGNDWGRLPVDAAMLSDVAVGIGISSAIIESAIAGCKGIHCDLTCLYSHEFYKWGFERIIFDDLDRMIDALKKHKGGETSNINLGDWTPFLDKLDPFRDGRAGERMGTYIRWMLEAFDNGKNHNDSIEYANNLYRKEWGNDKVIDMKR